MSDHLCPPDSSVHGILQARILEWVAIPFSRGSSQPRDRTQVSHIAGRFFTIWATRETCPFKNLMQYSNYCWIISKSIFDQKVNFFVIVILTVDCILVRLEEAMETILWNIFLSFAVKVTEKSEFTWICCKMVNTLALLNDSIYIKENSLQFKDGWWGFHFFWLRWIFVAMCWLSLVVVSSGSSLLWCTGSRRPGFSSCSTWTQ